MLEMLHDWEISNEARNAGHEEGLNKGLIEGRIEGLNEGRNEMFNFAIDFLKSKGMSNEEINDFRNAAMQSQRWETKS